ncbi:hypothetical protein SRHO_G00046640 [Serrasalmus rhombeus]
MSCTSPSLAAQSVLFLALGHSRMRALESRVWIAVLEKRSAGFRVKRLIFTMEVLQLLAESFVCTARMRRSSL